MLSVDTFMQHYRVWKKESGILVFVKELAGVPDLTRSVVTLSRKIFRQIKYLCPEDEEDLFVTTNYV
jgi:hypothetical protein